MADIDIESMVAPASAGNSFNRFRRLSTRVADFPHSDEVPKAAWSSKTTLPIHFSPTYITEEKYVTRNQGRPS